MSNIYTIFPIRIGTAPKSQTVKIPNVTSEAQVSRNIKDNENLVAEAGKYPATLEWRCHLLWQWPMRICRPVVCTRFNKLPKLLHMCCLKCINQDFC